MADVSRSRTSILTLQTYMQGLISAAQPTWDVRLFPVSDLEQIFKVYWDLRVDTGACIIAYAGAKWGTFEKPSPVRQLLFKIILAYNIYNIPASAVNYMQTMIESTTAALDCQIYNNQSILMIQKDSMTEPIDKGSGVTTAIVDIAVDDKSG